MRHTIKILQKGDWYTFTRSTNPKTGKIVYTIEVSSSICYGGTTGWAEVRKHFDPAGNRGNRYSMRWKYRNRTTPEHLLTLAILKWGA